MYSAQELIDYLVDCAILGHTRFLHIQGGLSLGLVNFTGSMVPTAVVKRLLSYALGSLTDANLNQVLEQVYCDPMTVLYVLVDNNAALGIAGLRHSETGTAEILHIAVDEHRRNQGIGRRILEELKAQETVTELIAETDLDAVDFYRKCGFNIRSLGEKYPGVERFHCRLTFSPQKQA